MSWRKFDALACSIELLVDFGHDSWDSESSNKILVIENHLNECQEVVQNQSDGNGNDCVLMFWYWIINKWWETCAYLTENTYVFFFMFHRTIRILLVLESMNSVSISIFKNFVMVWMRILNIIQLSYIKYYRLKKDNLI